jgi:hypothetical protein
MYFQSESNYTKYDVRNLQYLDNFRIPIPAGFRDYAVKNKLVSGEDWLHLFQSNQVKFYAILTQYLFRYTDKTFKGTVLWEYL